MSDPARPKEKTDWRRIGLIATVLLVPGGFVLGGMLAARRMRAAAVDKAVETDPSTVDVPGLAIAAACWCRSLDDLAIVPMGARDGLDERVFATLDNVLDHGGDQWWLYLSRCSACGQNWLVAQEERIFDDYFLRRLDSATAEKVVSDGDWPDDFMTYEQVLEVGTTRSSHCIYLETLSPALVDTVKDLRRQRPAITVSEISRLIGVPLKVATRLLAK